MWLLFIILCSCTSSTVAPAVTKELCKDNFVVLNSNSSFQVQSPNYPDSYSKTQSCTTGLQVNCANVENCLLLVQLPSTVNCTVSYRVCKKESCINSTGVTICNETSTEKTHSTFVALEAVNETFALYLPIGAGLAFLLEVSVLTKPSSSTSLKPSVVLSSTNRPMHTTAIDTNLTVTPASTQQSPSGTTLYTTNQSIKDTTSQPLITFTVAKDGSSTGPGFPTSTRTKFGLWKTEHKVAMGAAVGGVVLVSTVIVLACLLGVKSMQRKREEQTGKKHAHISGSHNSSFKDDSAEIQLQPDKNACSYKGVTWSPRALISGYRDVDLPNGRADERIKNHIQGDHSSVATELVDSKDRNERLESGAQEVYALVNKPSKKDSTSRKSESSAEDEELYASAPDIPAYKYTLQHAPVVGEQPSPTSNNDGVAKPQRAAFHGYSDVDQSVEKTLPVVVRNSDDKHRLGITENADNKTGGTQEMNNAATVTSSPSYDEMIDNELYGTGVQRQLPDAPQVYAVVNKPRISGNVPSTAVDPSRSSVSTDEEQNPYETGPAIPAFRHQMEKLSLTSTQATNMSTCNGGLVIGSPAAGDKLTVDKQLPAAVEPALGMSRSGHDSNHTISPRSNQHVGMIGNELYVTV